MWEHIHGRAPKETSRTEWHRWSPISRGTKQGEPLLCRHGANGLQQAGHASRHDCVSTTGLEKPAYLDPREAQPELGVVHMSSQNTEHQLHIRRRCPGPQACPSSVAVPDLLPHRHTALVGRGGARC
eukprot:360339-Chlamydomonas_euryale.AAC.10